MTILYTLLKIVVDNKLVKKICAKCDICNAHLVIGKDFSTSTMIRHNASCVKKHNKILTDG